MEEELQSLQKATDLARDIAVNYGFQFIAALFILLIGWQIAKWCGALVLKLCTRLDLDITLSRFFAGLAKTVVIVFVVIIALGKFGITIAPFIAALGAVVFGSTLALQGPISNYGAGLTIILTRPFIVGDTIRVDGVIGVVKEIKLAYTLITNEDEEQIMIPNNRIIGQVIINSFQNLIVEEALLIDYAADPDMAIRLIEEQLASHADVVAEPKPQVGINSFADAGIQLGIRYWIPTQRYFELKYQINNTIFKSLKNANITIAYPRQIVELKNQ